MKIILSWIVKHHYIACPLTSARLMETPAISPTFPNPYCFNMHELPQAPEERAKISRILGLLKTSQPLKECEEQLKATPLFIHLSHGLALTTGSALGSLPPTKAQCLEAYQLPNSVGLTAGARAWTKHAHRSQELHPANVSKKYKGEAGWWGRAQGPKTVLNENALELFWRIVNTTSWRNLHWLPHKVLVYEMREPEGYGMRWSQDQSVNEGEDGEEGRRDLVLMGRPWVFRGFVEPMIENGHEVGWRHSVSPSSGPGSKFQQEPLWVSSPPPQT